MYQRRAIGLTLLLVLATMSVAATRGQSGPDRQLLVGATIVDGTGSIAYRGDVLLEGDRIAAIGTSGSLHPSDSEGALAVIDLAGLVLAPGFIDIHNHSTESLKDDALAMTQVAQGITTIMVGADGSSPWPIGEYLDGIDALSTALNVGTLVGHGLTHEDPSHPCPAQDGRAHGTAHQSCGNADGDVQCGTVGMADTHLQRTESVIARTAAPSGGGKNPDMILYALNAGGGCLDPAFDAHVLPIQAWAFAWW